MAVGYNIPIEARTPWSNANDRRPPLNRPHDHLRSGRRRPVRGRRVPAASGRRPRGCLSSTGGRLPASRRLFAGAKVRPSRLFFICINGAQLTIGRHFCISGLEKPAF